MAANRLVPKLRLSYQDQPLKSLEVFHNFLDRYKGKILLVTGAGVSLYSGIPSEVGNLGYANPYFNYKFQGIKSFNYSSNTRQRLWSRYLIQHTLLYQDAHPNPVHKSIANLSNLNLFSTHITLNVDGLFKKTNMNNKPIEMLGNTFNHFECGSCKTQIDQQSHLRKLLAFNPYYKLHIDQLQNGSRYLPPPDKFQNHRYYEEIKGLALLPPTSINGDYLLDNRIPYKFFQVLPCSNCNGLVQPNTVLPGQYIGDLTANLIAEATGYVANLEEPIEPYLDPHNHQVNRYLPVYNSNGIQTQFFQFKMYDTAFLPQTDLSPQAIQTRLTQQPQAILVLGSSLLNDQIRNLCAKPHLRHLPLLKVGWRDPDLVTYDQKVNLRAPLPPLSEHLTCIEADLLEFLDKA